MTFHSPSAAGKPQFCLAGSLQGACPDSGDLHISISTSISIISSETAVAFPNKLGQLS